MNNRVLLIYGIIFIAMALWVTAGKINDIPTFVFDTLPRSIAIFSGVMIFFQIADRIVPGEKIT